MQDNFHSINDTYGFDHVAFDQSGVNNGFHTNLHLQQISSPGSPGANANNYNPILSPVQTPSTTNVAQLFSVISKDGYSTDNALYFRQGTSGQSIQLTSNITPVGATAGITFLPGGIIMQWGFINNTSGNPVVLYSANSPNRAFKNTTFNVQVTRLNNGTAAQMSNFWIQTSSVDKTGFTIINGDTHTWQYYWVAMGN